MTALTDRQLSALKARACFDGNGIDRFAKGIRDAAAVLRQILADHPEDRYALRRALLEFVADGPVWDSTAYQDGQACVYDDVEAVLNGYAEVINELLAESGGA